MSRTRNTWIVGVLIAAGTTLTSAADWVVVTNPVTHQPEAVWSRAHDEVVDVCHAYLASESWTESVVLGQATESAAPALTVSETGDRIAAWEDDERRVLLRTWPAGESGWGGAIRVSEADENAGGPSVLPFESETFVSYEAVSEGGTRWVTVAKMDPDGTPQRDVIRTCEAAEALRPGLVATASTLFVDWFESPSRMGYATYSHGAWSEPVFQTFETMPPEAMRAHLREMLLEE